MTFETTQKRAKLNLGERFIIIIIMTSFYFQEDMRVAHMSFNNSERMS